jgi:hypothetical protein
MKLISINPFLAAAKMGGMAYVDNLLHTKSPSEEPVPNDRIVEWEIAGWGLLFAELEKQCTDLELTASVATIRKLRRAVVATPSHKALHPLRIELEGRLDDEMRGKIFFTLNMNEAALYNSPREGWQEIIGRFPDVVTDIEEASKCFALSRYAAAVFHSIQVVEIGLIELGRVIVATDHQTGWNATTNRLNKIIAAKHSDRTSFQQQHFQFLEQINATIESLKTAWRNKISHAQGKLALLTSDFTPEVAEEILFASRAFMRRLATDAPTSPDPDA